MIDQAISLLQLLSDGKPHSGNELGEKLGVSRAAIWKLTQKLQTHFGVEIATYSGVGYALLTPIVWLNKQAIHDYLRSNGFSCEVGNITICNSTSSTNDLALSAAAKGAANFSVWLAEHQSSGRGRRGKVWQSPMLGNVYCSVLWRFSGGAHALEGLSLIVGIAIAEAISSWEIPEVKLKWPNDILISGRKVGGVLIEITGDPVGECAAVIGFGINLHLPAKIEASIDQPVTGLSSLVREIDRNLLISKILNNICSGLLTHRRAGFSAFSDRWSSYDALAGKKVRVSSGDGFDEGECLGVNHRGALLVKIGAKIEEVFSGEVSVRSQ